jgi:lysophospholipase L1-like esterase
LKPYEPEKIRILGFGDSLTAGYPGYDPSYRRGNEKSQYGFWLIEFAKQNGWPNIEFDNHGIPGELARHMHDRLTALLGKKCYEIVIILSGTNDIGCGFDPRQIFEELRSLWKVATESGAKVIACTIPPIGSLYPPIQKAQEVLNRQILTASTSTVDILGIDLFSALSGSDGLLKPDFDCGDGLHLTVEGYRCMGELIWTKGVRAMLGSGMS